MKKVTQIIYVIEFLIIIFGMGIVSCIKLLDYYSNPYKVNNNFSVFDSSPLEQNLAYSFAGKNQFININGGINKFLNRPIMNDVIRLENGYLLSAISYSIII